MTTRIVDVMGVVSALRQEWFTPGDVAHELDISASTAGRVLADAARDGLLSRRRLSQWKVIYSLLQEKP